MPGSPHHGLAALLLATVPLAAQTQRGGVAPSVTVEETLPQPGNVLILLLLEQPLSAAAQAAYDELSAVIDALR